ncbi:MAG: hypothetical protein ACRCUS_10590, partial [Anaerovoracaceae bacterium]
NYKFLAYFSNLSTSRITSIRVTYEVKNSLVFDKIFVLENNLSTYQLTAEILNQLTTDLSYNVGDLAVLKLYGKISTGTSNISITYNDLDNLTMLERTAPTTSIIQMIENKQDKMIKVVNSFDSITDITLADNTEYEYLTPLTSLNIYNLSSLTSFGSISFTATVGMVFSHPVSVKINGGVLPVFEEKNYLIIYNNGVLYFSLGA